jgi:hypothetical protein
MTKKIEEATDMIGGKSDSGNPVSTGNTHANRIADAGNNAEPTPGIDPKDGPSTKAEVIMYTADYLAGLTQIDALDYYYKLVNDIRAKDATYSGGNTQATTAMASIATKEDLELVFASDESLSEDFKSKASTIFEAAIKAAITVETAKLEEANEAKLEEAVESVKADLATRVGDFLDYVAEGWVKENKLAIEASIRTEAVDSFLSGLKGLFAEHYVDVPADKVNVVESLTAEVEATEAKLNEETAKNIALSKELRAVKAAAILESKMEGLTDTQKDKFRSLAGVYEDTSVEEYDAKLTTIAEAVATKSAPVLREDTTVDPVEPEAAAKVIDPQMAVFLSALKRTAR